MKIKPVGFLVLIEIEEISTETESGIITSSGTEATRAQGGHDVGTVVDIGPTVFHGYAGCPGETADERCEQWGFGVGDKVIFKSYVGDQLPGSIDEGKHLRQPSRYISIVDKHIIAKIEEE